MNTEALRRFEISDRVALVGGEGGLTKLAITTNVSSAEIYLHGAHISGFRKNGDPSLLFMSRKGQFAPGQPIRGGVPICFPWFGPREGDVAHGFARIFEWELIETATPRDDETTVRLRLPAGVRPEWAPIHAEFVVTITDRLAMTLTVSNTSIEKTFEFEDCLHTYLALGDVNEATIRGLKGARFLDRTDNGAEKIEPDNELRIRKETNRLYPDTTGAVEVVDGRNRRVIRIEKKGSASTVVWNPWTTQLLPDFDPAEHRQMVCVESGNVGSNRISLPPGASHVLEATLGSARMC